MEYWFYAKIGFPDPKGSDDEKYLLASEIEPFDHTFQPAYNKRAPGFKLCVEAFMTACQVCGGRDVVEEFLARGFGLCPLVGLLEGSSRSVLLGWRTT